MQSTANSHKDNKEQFKITMTELLMHPCGSHTLVFYPQVKAPEQLEVQTEVYHLNILVLAIATQPTSLAYTP